jgi:hypothetical protein
MSMIALGCACGEGSEETQIQRAFDVQTLAGMGLLEGFETGGCGCGSLAGLASVRSLVHGGIGGLGVAETSDQGSGEGQTPGTTGTVNAVNACSDTSLWAVKKGQDGKCYQYCAADITQQFEIDSSYCAIGSPAVTTKLPAKSGTGDLNYLLIGGIALAALFLARG